MNKEDEKEVIIKIIHYIIFYESFCLRDMIINYNLLSTNIKLGLIDRYYQSKKIYKRIVKYYK